MRAGGARRAGARARRAAARARAGARALSDRARAAAAAVLLAGPFALAFWTGGGPDVPRLVAAVAAWALVAAGAVVGRPALPRGAWAAAGGLLALTGLSLASAAWSPVPSAALDAAQRAALYAGALLAALLLAPRRTEPAVLAGCAVVAAYALGDRLLPGLLTYEASISAQGRLEQPITYWNGLGALAALGVVLAARHAPWLAAPLGLALALTASRGAILACVAGLLVLVLTTRRAGPAAVALAAAAVPGAAGLALEGPAQRLGDDRTGEGLVVLAVLVATTLVAARVRVPAWPVRPPRGAGWVVAGAVAAAIAVGAGGGDPGRADASRLAQAGSNRPDYWEVALRAFAGEPLAGVGAGGWAAEWLRERPYREGVRDAHSLPLQTAAELGLLGLLALGAFAGATALAARRAAPGVAAGLAVLATHQAIDWDWQLPAVTLPAVLLAAAALRAPPRPAAPPGGTPAPPRGT